MATLLDLFKSQKSELYGKSEGIRIESRGILNPPRAAALIASSPNTIADLIGTNAAGVIKGSANRPSDTIYNDTKVLSKPLSITGVTTAQLRDVVESGKDYYIKKSPMPNVVGGFLQGASNPAGAISNQVIKAANTYGSAKKIKGLLKQIKEGKSTLPTNPEQYGTKFMPETKFGTEVLKETKKFTDYYRDETGKLKKRNDEKKGTQWSVGQEDLLTKLHISDSELKDPKYANHIITTFEIIPADGVTPVKVPFIGTINGISEEVTPSWNSFKYLGSPFNIYRYGGVERSLRFNLKLYYTTSVERDVMIAKINYLKSLAFPDTNIKGIQFGQDDKTNSQYAMAPNLVKISIGSLYKNIPGYVESLSFTIEDNTAWPNFDSFEKDANAFLYPSIVDVSVGMKIIENHTISSTPPTVTNANEENKLEKKKQSVADFSYNYNFDGVNPFKPISESTPNPQNPKTTTNP